jgi:23S rRNA (cytosine1962-C5)-methyltransferase
MKTWRLRMGADKRIRAAHPWVFSNELSESPKGIEPGTPVTLQDAKGNFLASGYGNPHSLISFRVLSWDSQVIDATEEKFLIEKVLSAWRQRKNLGYHKSFRLCYGEGDFLPGLVIDRYQTLHGQVLAVQILTAGIQRALKNMEDFFKNLVFLAHQEKLCAETWDQTSIVIRNDVNIRKLEGLQYEESKILVQAKTEKDLSHVEIVLNNGTLMSVDLHQGQKTGFFLDQDFNIMQLCQMIKVRQWPKKVKILDLCCYVGQWSAQIARTFQELGIECETVLVDVSDHALSFAKQNSIRQKATAEVHKMDVLQDLPKLADRSFDIVIADPPAFIKAKKDIPTGKHAYLKLNTQAFRLVKSGGFVVSCSCSGLFEEKDLIDVLRKSIIRDGRSARCVSHGGHSADHPVLMSFSEGFYLKMLIHHVANENR